MKEGILKYYNEHGPLIDAFSSDESMGILMGLYEDGRLPISVMKRLPSALWEWLVSHDFILLEDDYVISGNRLVSFFDSLGLSGGASLSKKLKRTDSKNPGISFISFAETFQGVLHDTVNSPATLFPYVIQLQGRQLNLYLLPVNAVEIKNRR